MTKASKDDPRTQNLNLRTTRAIKTMVEELAARQDRSISNCVEQLIREAHGRTRNGRAA